MPTDDEPSNPLNQFIRPIGIPGPLDKAATYIRENWVLPFRKKERPVYYHRRFNRVPTIDECEIGDYMCRYEADQQFKRDKQVDNFKLKILRRRWTECNYYWGESRTEKCMKERTDYLENSVNWFIRYGEVGTDYDVLDNYMKQKHRMIYQRRKEEVGENFKYAQ